MLNAFALFTTCFVFAISCNNNNSTQAGDNRLTIESASQQEKKIPVEECNPATNGYWSVVRNDCILLPRDAIELAPQEAATDKTKPAWIIFSDDQIKVEIVLPTQSTSVIIRKSSLQGEPGRWENGPLTLSFSDGTYSLYEEEKKLYSGTPLN